MKRHAARQRATIDRAPATWTASLHPWIVGAATALFIARLLWPSESVAWRGDGLPLAFLWLVLAGAWLTGGLLDQRLSVRFSWPDVALAALVSWHTLAAIWSAAHDAPRPAINMLWEWVALGCGYWIVRQCVTTPREARALVVVMIAAAGGISLLGLNEYFHTMPATRAAFEANPEAALAEGGLYLPPGSVERQLFVQRLYSHEPAGTFGLANSLAGFLVAWLTVIAGIALAAREADPRRRRVWLAALLTAVPIGICLVLTKSRSAYVALSVGIALLAVGVSGFRRHRLKFSGAALAIVIMSLLVGVLTGTLDREVLTEAPKSLGFRAQYWQSTLAMIAEHPWLGCGPGNFGDHYTRFKLPTASEEIADPHNGFLEVWATAGTPALVALLVTLGLVLWYAWRAASDDVPHSPAAESPNAIDGNREIFAGGIAGFLAAMVVPIVAGPLIYAPTAPGLLIVALIAAAIIGLSWRSWVVSGTIPASLPAIAVVVLLIDLLAAGGIGFPAVAGTLWLLAALSLNLTLSASANFVVTLSRPKLLAAWLGMFAIVAACYATAYHPAVVAQAEIAGVHHDPRRAEELLTQAAGADRFAAEPWVELAEVRFATWRAAPTAERFAAFESAQAAALARRPSQSRLHLRMAEHYLEAFARTHNPRDAEVALAAARRAVELYPNHARERARLAMVYHAVGGHVQDATREAERALELDGVTPHADQKLPDSLRRELLPLLESAK